MLAFLNYYNESIALLREFVGSEGQKNEATLITILVLTTIAVGSAVHCFIGQHSTDVCIIIQEYCGDLVNLINHYQAAKVLMLDLLTLESINSNEIHLNIFLWYSRFDVLSALLSMREPSLPVDWYRAKEKYDASQAGQCPNDLTKRLTLVASIIRRAGAEMASVYSNLSQGKLTLTDFSLLNIDLHEILGSAKELLQNPSCDSALMDKGALRDINHAWVDYLAWEAMLKYQTMVILKQPLSSELRELAQRQRDLIERIDKTSGDQKTIPFSFKISLMMASFFLPQETETQVWIRKKLASIERNG